MRTTLDLLDDVFAAAEEFAVERSITLSEAITELVRRAIPPSVTIDKSGPFPHFVVPPGTRIITLEATLEAEDDW